MPGLAIGLAIGNAAAPAAAQAVELLDVARQRLERATQQLDFAETRLEVGTATRSDLLRAELEVGMEPGTAAAGD